MRHLLYELKRVIAYHSTQSIFNVLKFDETVVSEHYELHDNDK
jgi:hypothetical protein